MVCSGSIGRVEQRMDEAGGDLKEIKLAIHSITAHILSGEHLNGSVLSFLSDDDPAVWREIRRELRKDGIRSSTIRKHKETIKAYILELGDRGLLDDNEFAKADDETKGLENMVSSIGRNSQSSRNGNASVHEEKQMVDELNEGESSEELDETEGLDSQNSLEFEVIDTKMTSKDHSTKPPSASNGPFKHPYKWTDATSQKVNAEIFYQTCAVAQLFPERGLERMKTQFFSKYGIRLEFSQNAGIESCDSWIGICESSDGALMFQPSSDRPERRAICYGDKLYDFEYDLRNMLIFDFKKFIHNHMNLIEEGMECLDYSADYKTRLFDAMAEAYRLPTSLDTVGIRTGRIFLLDATKSRMLPAMIQDSIYNDLMQEREGIAETLEKVLNGKPILEGNFIAIGVATQPEQRSSCSSTLDVLGREQSIREFEDLGSGKAADTASARRPSKNDKIKVSKASKVFAKLNAIRLDLAYGILPRCKQIAEDVIEIGQDLIIATQNPKEHSYQSIGDNFWPPIIGASETNQLLVRDIKILKSKLTKIDPKLTKVALDSGYEELRKMRADISDIIDDFIKHMCVSAEETYKLVITMPVRRSEVPIHGRPDLERKRWHITAYRQGLLKLEQQKQRANR